MSKLGFYITVYDEQQDLKELIQSIRKFYLDSEIFIASDGGPTLDMRGYDGIQIYYGSDTIGKVITITSDPTDFKRPENQEYLKSSVIITIDRLKQAIKYCKSEYVLMCDPDVRLFGLLTIPEGCRLLGSNINSGHVINSEFNNVLKKYGASLFSHWGATPGIFHCETFLKCCEKILQGSILSELCSSTYAMFAHDFLLPTIFSFGGFKETFNPDIVECKRNHNWKQTGKPLVHQYGK